ncbi:hypothetical protein [Pelobacter propionicus]|uniref:Uncharacterized protein n=1 Tax=Pelobacter propionicus (strain DSM 2379 / NBRC 103807 / OttBd1) TaxID=338966 RepID=A1AQ16_PELPD|nr:hypothetical protein [Pelobacter propionicus]ABK99436.1 hypothetical protein Ppro_1824 [Pelobacter propionicus DSM 2379]
MNYFQRLALRALRQPESRATGILDDPFETVASWDLDQRALPGTADAAPDPVREVHGSRQREAAPPSREGNRPVNGGEIPGHIVSSLSFPTDVPPAQQRRTQRQERPVPAEGADERMVAGDPPSLAESLQPSASDVLAAETSQALARADAFMRSLQGALPPPASTLPETVADLSVLAGQHPLPMAADGAMRPSAVARRLSQEVTPPSSIPLDGPRGRSAQTQVAADGLGEGGVITGKTPSASIPPAHITTAQPPGPVVIVHSTEQRGSGEHLGLGAPRFGLGQL